MNDRRRTEVGEQNERTEGPSLEESGVRRRMESGIFPKEKVEEAVHETLSQIVTDFIGWLGEHMRMRRFVNIADRASLQALFRRFVVQDPRRAANAPAMRQRLGGR
jgi:hypothetical protein